MLPAAFRKNGFTLIEVLVVMAIFLGLFAMSVLVFSNMIPRATLDGVVSTVRADLLSQQNKAMIGETGGAGSASSFGIAFTTDSYTLFRGDSRSSGQDEATTTLPEGLIVTTSFPQDEVVFSTRSGASLGGSGTITLFEESAQRETMIEVNQLGVIENVE
ncbi:MAG: type II secretion system protein [Pseudomonadales bacterium]|nr:type II secretion system protein [Candidatus Woesebacteria bacterium]MCB9801514.1 type II secretion system protein [Pseudomonadales bacterium]